MLNRFPSSLIEKFNLIKMGNFTWSHVAVETLGMCEGFRVGETSCIFFFTTESETCVMKFRVLVYFSVLMFMISVSL